MEYYQRLEQGRANHPSNEVLDALAEVLRLDATERGYLGRLANPARNQLDELSTGSVEFAELWSAGEVAVRTHGSKNFRHPTVGVLTLNYENLELPGDLRQRLVTFSPDPATATDAALRVLGSQTYVSR